MERSTCCAAGCENQTRTLSSPNCEKHYHQLRRAGELPATKVTCVHRGCNHVATTRGYCTKHYTRVRRYGNPDIVRPTGSEPGPQHPSWTGDNVGYDGAHARVQRERGPARDHQCVDCGHDAQHWSYDHADPCELGSTDGPYSPDPDHYEPRCVSCHKQFDLAIA